MTLQDQIKNLEPRKAILVGLVIAALYYFMFYNSGVLLDQQTQKINADINTKQARLNNLQRTLQNKEAFQKEIEELSFQFQKLLKYFPEDIRMNKLSKSLSVDLEHYGNEVDTIKSIDLTTRFSGYDENGLEVVASGNFHTILKFLASLTEIDKVVDFKKLKMSDFQLNGETGVLKLRLVLSFFSKKSQVKK